MWLFDLLKHKEQGETYAEDKPAFVCNLNDDGYSSRNADIIKNYKEVKDMPTNEYVNGFIERKNELETQKLALENENIENIVEARFAEEKDKIRELVLKEHTDKIEDIDVEIKAIERLIDKELAKLQAEQEKENETVEE